MTGIRIAEENPGKQVSVVGRDTDLTVILLQCMGDTKNLRLVQPQPGEGEERRFKVINLVKTRSNLKLICHVLLPIHAFSGCDTTSAMYRKGKKRLISLAKNSEEIRKSLEVFNSLSVSLDEIIADGEFIFIKIYDLSFKSLDTARYY